MMILHSADWHMDTPFAGRSQEDSEYLRRELLKVPAQIADICRSRLCDLVLLSGDLFDGAYTRESYLAVYHALERMAVPVFVSPGNHDYCSPDSPWIRERWPENVHIFTQQRIVSVAVPELDCRIYGAGYQSMDCPGLLEGFRAEDGEKYHIGLLHTDPVQQTASPYCPVTPGQVRESGLHYLAAGHIHKAGSFRAGDTLCAWPGCPMGRGYDETGVKGIFLVNLQEIADVEWIPLDVPQFLDLEAEAGDAPLEAVKAVLPPVANNNFYRVTLTGYASEVDLKTISSELGDFVHLELRDKTLPETDLWSIADEDSLEGTYFRMLRSAMEGQDGDTCRRIRLAAQISRQILDGQEVRLP